MDQITLTQLQTIAIIIGVIVQLVGLVYAVFKIGRFTGSTEQVLKNIVLDQANAQTIMAEHIETDNHNFEMVRADIANVRVDIAGIGGRPHKREA